MTQKIPDSAVAVILSDLHERDKKIRNMRFLIDTREKEINRMKEAYEAALKEYNDLDQYLRDAGVTGWDTTTDEERNKQ